MSNRRFVRCPTCRKPLVEHPTNPVYPCSKCGTIIRAKNQEQTDDHLDALTADTMSTCSDEQMSQALTDNGSFLSHSSSSSSSARAAEFIVGNDAHDVYSQDGAHGIQRNSRRTTTMSPELRNNSGTTNAAEPISERDVRVIVEQLLKMGLISAGNYTPPPYQRQELQRFARSQSSFNTKHFPERNEQSPDSSAHSLDRSSRRSRRRPAKHHCRPNAGSSPFVICDRCLKLQQLPMGIPVRREDRIRCGSCYEVMKLPVPTNLTIRAKKISRAESEEEVFPEQFSEANIRHLWATALGNSVSITGRPTRDQSLNYSQSLSDEGGKHHPSAAPLHIAMGYDSYSFLLRSRQFDREV